jgi:hypothetical protein
MKSRPRLDVFALREELCSPTLGAKTKTRQGWGTHTWAETTVSHPFARKKAKGWGTEVLATLSHSFARKKAKGWGTEVFR